MAAAAGTAVTEEVFFEWKRKFDAELAAKKAKEKGAKVDDKKKKLTGRAASTKVGVGHHGLADMIVVLCRVRCKCHRAPALRDRRVTYHLRSDRGRRRSRRGRRLAL